MPFLFSQGMISAEKIEFVKPHSYGNSIMIMAIFSAIARPAEHKELQILRQKMGSVQAAIQCGLLFISMMS